MTIIITMNMNKLGAQQNRDSYNTILGYCIIVWNLQNFPNFNCSDLSIFYSANYYPRHELQQGLGKMFGPNWLTFSTYNQANINWAQQRGQGWETVSATWLCSMFWLLGSGKSVHYNQQCPHFLLYMTKGAAIRWHLSILLINNSPMFS